MDPFRRGTRRGGYTLVELMIAGAIFTMTTALTLSTTYALQFAARQERIQNDLEVGATQIMDYMQRDINRGAGIMTSFAGYSTSDRSLVIRIPVFDENEVPLADVFAIVAYEYLPQQQSVDRVEMVVDGNGSEEVSFARFENINRLTLFFDHLNLSGFLGSGKPLEDAHLIDIHVVNQREKDGRRYTRSFSGLATLRNKR